jgi:predicted acyl esterase
MPDLHCTALFWTSFLFFLGIDPFHIIHNLNVTSRNMEAKILNVRLPQYNISQTARHLTIPLQDGVEMAATLYSPLDNNGRFNDSPRPVILIRTPYNRDSLASWGA